MAIELITNIASNFSIQGAYETIYPLAIFVLGMVVYSGFIYKFYKFLGRKDIFELNLSQYNRSKFGFFKKLMAVIFYIIEYLLIFPIITFFWFAVLAVLLAVLSKNQTLETILLVAIAVVAAVRVTAYFSEDLSKDLAKMLPFALLGIFLIDSTILGNITTLAIFTQVTSLWVQLLYYLIFVLALEFVLRVIYTILKPALIEDDKSGRLFLTRAKPVRKKKKR